MWSTVQGELARVNGLTGRVDTRQAVPERQDASGAAEPVRPLSHPAGPVHGQGERLRPGDAGHHLHYGHSAGPGHHRRAAQRRRIRHRRRAGRGAPARSGHPAAGRRAAAIPARHHRRRVRRQGPVVDRGAQRGHRHRHHPGARRPTTAGRAARRPARPRCAPTRWPSPGTTWHCPHWTMGWPSSTRPTASCPRCAATS